MLTGILLLGFRGSPVLKTKRRERKKNEREVVSVRVARPFSKHHECHEKLYENGTVYDGAAWT